MTQASMEAEPVAANPISDAWAVLRAAINEDPEYAWGWHCNLAMPIMDAIGVSHEQANTAAATLMHHLFDCDMTSHPHYEYGKSGAQQYAEFRRAPLRRPKPVREW